MNKKARLVIGLLILGISISLLLWGYLPNRHEVIDRDISPAEMQLPTPTSLHFSLTPVS